QATRVSFRATGTIVRIRIGRPSFMIHRIVRMVRSGTSTLLAGKVAMTLAHGLVLIVLGRAEGAAGVGLYTLALAIVSPIFLFGHLRLQDRVATDPLGAQRWRAYRGAMTIGIAIA